MKMLGRLVVLALMSAITAEFLLGDQWLNGARIEPASQVALLLLYAAYYGSAAILIREIARRTGHGWPTILLLALAFALLEEGIVDQSLFNPDFVGRHLLRFGFIPALGIAGPWTVFVLSLHVIWSIGAPIAIAEQLFPHPLPGTKAVAPQVQAPWASVPALVVAGVLGFIGGSAIFAGTVIGGHFMAAPGQLIASITLIALLVVVSLLLLPRATPRRARPLVTAVLIGAAVTSAFVAVDLLERRFAGGPWFAATLELGVLAIGVIAATALLLDVLGLAAGAMLTYCWVGMTRAVPLGTGPALEQVVIVAVVLGVVALAIRRRLRSAALHLPEPSPTRRATLDS